MTGSESASSGPAGAAKAATSQLETLRAAGDVCVTFPPALPALEGSVDEQADAINCCLRLRAAAKRRPSAICQARRDG